MRLTFLACLLAAGACGTKPRAAQEQMQKGEQGASTRAAQEEPSAPASSAPRSAPVSPPEAATLAADLDRICNAERYSGALEQEEGARALATARWLALNLRSQEGRDLSATLAKLPNPERIARLRRAAAAESISPCPMLASWGAR